MKSHLRSRYEVVCGDSQDANPRLAQPLLTLKAVRTPRVSGREPGYDPVKNIKGRKRHLLVETLGLALRWSCVQRRSQIGRSETNR